MKQAFTAEEHIVLALAETRPVAYRPEFAKALGSVNAGVLLSQFLYWSKNARAVDREGWFYKTSDELYDEIGLSRKEQYTARKILGDVEILETQKRGVPSKNWYRIDLEKLVAFLTQRHIKSSLFAQQGVPEGDDLLSPKGKTLLYTEITTETTTTKSAPAAQAYDEESIRLTDLLYWLSAENYPNLNHKPPTKAAYKALDDIHRLDRYAYPIIEAVIRWSQQDVFWKKNIRSTEKLRKQFDTLLVQSQGDIDKRAAAGSGFTRV